MQHPALTNPDPGSWPRGVVSAALLDALQASESPREGRVSTGEMEALEAAHRVADLFIWLSFRLEHGFEGRPHAEATRAALGARIEEGLAALGRAPPPRKSPRAPGSKRCGRAARGPCWLACGTLHCSSVHGLCIVRWLGLRRCIGSRGWAVHVMLFVRTVQALGQAASGDFTDCISAFPLSAFSRPEVRAGMQACWRRCGTWSVIMACSIVHFGWGCRERQQARRVELAKQRLIEEELNGTSNWRSDARKRMLTKTAFELELPRRVRSNKQIPTSYESEVSDR